VTSLRLLVEQAHGDRRAIVLPGAYDALSAKLVQRAGFPAVYLTGAGLANGAFGVPDIGLVSVTEMREQIARIADVVSIPLVVDGDTGFGNAINTARTVRHFERAGASAIQLEDQVFPKKCGHFSGKAVIPTAEMVQKLHAATDARSSEDFLIIARTDARATSGLDEALDRAAAYKQAGADILFIEAPRTKEELEIIGSKATGPLLANMVEGALTPITPVAELESMGFTMVLYANAALRVAHRAIARALEVLADTGTTTSIADDMATWEQRQDIVDKPLYDALETRYEVGGAQ